MTLPVRRRDGGSAPERWTPWEPLAGLEDLYRRMGQLMERTFGEGIGSGLWQMPVDIEETDDAYVIEADLPGVNRDDLSLEWNDRQLTIRGEIKERERKGFLRQQTRRTGQFHYTVTLPGDVDGDKIEASLAEGVLTVRAPKAATSKARRIEVGQGRRAGEIGKGE